MRFRHRPLEVEVIQWFKPGDHSAECPCGNEGPHLQCDEAETYTAFTALALHPGNFIVSHADGTHEVLTQAQLAERFEPVPISHGVAYHHA